MYLIQLTDPRDADSPRRNFFLCSFRRMTDWRHPLPPRPPRIGVTPSLLAPPQIGVTPSPPRPPQIGITPFLLARPGLASPPPSSPAPSLLACPRLASPPPSSPAPDWRHPLPPRLPWIGVTPSLLACPRLASPSPSSPAPPRLSPPSLLACPGLASPPPSSPAPDWRHPLPPRPPPPSSPAPDWRRPLPPHLPRIGVAPSLLARPGLASPPPSSPAPDWRHPLPPRPPRPGRPRNSGSVAPRVLRRIPLNEHRAVTSTFLCIKIIDSNQVFRKLTKLAMMAILTSEALLREKDSVTKCYPRFE